MDNQARQNMEMVKELMAKGEAEKKAALIAQGNKAHIPVDVEYTADSGEEYKGSFVFRRPSSMDYIRMGAIKSDILRISGVRPLFDVQTGRESMAHVDQGTLFLATALAAIKVLMVDCPAWFKDYENLYDTDLVIHVYNKFDEKLLSFRRQPKNGPAGRGETGNGPESMDSEETLRG